MNDDSVQDGAGPAVTFGSYVIAKTVRAQGQTPTYDYDMGQDDEDAQGHHADVPPPVAFDYYPAAQAGPDQRKWHHDLVHRVMGLDPRTMATGLAVVLMFSSGIIAARYLSAPDASGLEAAQVTSMPAPMADLADQLEAVVQASPVQQPASVTTALEDVVSASLDQSVTRTRSGDLIAPAGISRWDPTAELGMAEILRGLSPKPSMGKQSFAASGVSESQDILSRDKLGMLRDGVLAGRYTVKLVERQGKDRLCLRLDGLDVSEAEAADMLRQAAERGEIELPQALSTSDGTFDADTLIFNLVQTSLANDGTAEGAQAAKDMSRRAFAASKAKTRKIDGKRVYLVQPGDSLAYLSLQFYGQPSAYLKIFKANQPLLRSPDRIQIGQRLIIPG